MTHDELEAEVRRLREQVDFLTEILVEVEEDESDDVLSLEAQHAAFNARLKEKRR